MKYVCPNCKDTESRIWQLNTVLAEFPVESFNEGGEPDTFGAAMVVWDSAEVVDAERFQPYRCDCGHEFTTPFKLLDEKGARAHIPSPSDGTS